MAWTVDTAHTTVSFTARHMGLAKVRGLFREFDGVVEGDPERIEDATGRFEVNMASVDTGDETRDNHLRSEDFFDVERFPKMVFVSKKIERAGDDHRVVGDLTIKDITHEVELTYEHGGVGTDPYGNKKAGGTLTGTISRSDWELKWNVPLDGGGWLVSDKIRIEIDLQVAESKDAAQESAEGEAKVSA